MKNRPAWGKQARAAKLVNEAQHLHHTRRSPRQSIRSVFRPRFVRVLVGDFAGWEAVETKPLGVWPHAELVGVEFIDAPLSALFDPAALETIPHRRRP
jgi:hypothetical protein